MRINPQRFFNFCADHAALLRALGTHGAEFSEAEATHLIRANPGLGEELPETTWRRLREMQILVPTEPGSELFVTAEPVARLLNYLFNEANPATPEIIRGYVASLETAARQLARALDDEDVQRVHLAFEEISQTLHRIYGDLNETQTAILAEVTRYKTERSRVSVRDKYRRIVHWMERYVEPMIEIVRADGPLRAAFDEIEGLLRRTRDEALFNDHPALARNVRFLRLVGAHALRVFTQCRKEIQPLYESLRRSSFIAEGAARALEQLQVEGLSKWDKYLMGIAAWRYQNVPSDAAILATLRRIIEFPPEPPPILELKIEEEAPGALARLRWLESLPDLVGEKLPVSDLLEWLVRNFPERDTSDVLAGFSILVFHRNFNAIFTDRDPRTYNMADGEIKASPLTLISV
ncbi:MAG: hypothetical protein DMG30_01790 [Acidobacteria bacterium]|nr:MAG: hypothetical protein DMG30_01790 [Acidobacteriota bacterium]